MIININKDRSVTPRKFFAGTMNENNSTDITFEFAEELQDYHKRIVFILPNGKKPQDEIKDNTYTIKNDITKFNKVEAYLLLTKEGDKDWRSIEMEISFNHNEQPDEYEPTEEHTDIWDTMITVLEDKVTTVDNLAVELRDLITEVQRKLDEGEFNYVLTDEDKQEISDIAVPKVETNIQPILDETKDIAETAESIAKGRARTVVKDTWEEMQEWLRGVANKGTHNVGDNLYITAEYTDETETTRQPDYWITEVLEEPNEEGYYYNISTLGAEVPDLTNVVKKEDIAEMPLLATYEDGTQDTMRVVVFK